MARHCRATNGDKLVGRKTIEQMNKERAEMLDRLEKWTPKTIQDETNHDKARKLKLSICTKERQKGQDARSKRLQRHAEVTAKRREASARAIKASL